MFLVAEYIPGGGWPSRISLCRSLLRILSHRGIGEALSTLHPKSLLCKHAGCRMVLCSVLDVLGSPSHMRQACEVYSVGQHCWAVINSTAQQNTPHMLGACVTVILAGEQKRA